jgi:ribosomal protein L31E
VGGRVVMMKEPVVVAPKFGSFSSHIFSRASQNVPVKVRVDCSVTGSRLTVNNPLHVEENNEHVLC